MLSMLTVLVMSFTCIKLMASLNHQNLEVAVSPNGSDLKLYQLKDKSFEQTHTLGDVLMNISIFYFLTGLA